MTISDANRNCSYNLQTFVRVCLLFMGLFFIKDNLTSSYLYDINVKFIETTNPEGDETRKGNNREVEEMDIDKFTQKLADKTIGFGFRNLFFGTPDVHWQSPNVDIIEPPPEIFKTDPGADPIG